MASTFTPKLGRIGWKHGTRIDRYINRVMHAAEAAGHGKHSKSRFTGARIGRGSAFGTLAGAGLYPGGQRRVIVKARITKLKFGGLGAARAHLRYIQRDGVTPEGEAGELYGPETDEANGSLFLDKCDGDRHQFRLIVSADDATELADLKPFIRDLMVKVESDLGTRLDWVAVDHFNTGHPHTHIVIRGKDDRGDDLIIAKDYVSHSFRMRARELVTLELGPEIESDMTLKLSREVGANRFTRLDRALLNHTDRGFLVVSAMPPSDHQTHAAHLGRLRKLEDLGLAQERQTGVWQLADQIEPQLKSLGSRDDIIKTMHRAMREAKIDRPAGNFAMFDASKPNNRIVGRVTGIGLTDEINDKHYLVIDGIDGKVHYADIGHVAPELLADKGMIVSVESKAIDGQDTPRVQARILSYLNLAKLAEAEGATWLDKELLKRQPERIVAQGFGAQVNGALVQRRKWLIENSLGTETEQGLFKPSPNLLQRLRQRDLRQASVALSKELGLTYAEPTEGQEIAGRYSRSTHLASGKYAVIQKAKEFVLVPWQREFEYTKGKPITGTVSGQTITWGWGSERRKGIGGLAI